MGYKEVRETRPGPAPGYDPEAVRCLVPAVIAARSPHAGRRFVEFFTANIRNPKHAESVLPGDLGSTGATEPALGFSTSSRCTVAAWVESLEGKA
jgi:hypothetical protein